MHYPRPWGGWVDERYVVRWQAPGVQRLAVSALVPADPEQELLVALEVADGTTPRLLELPSGIPFPALERLFPQDHGRARGGGGQGRTSDNAPRAKAAGIERDFVSDVDRGALGISPSAVLLRLRAPRPRGLRERLFGGARHLWAFLELRPNTDRLYVPTATNLVGGRRIVYVQAKLTPFAGPGGLVLDARPANEGFEAACGAAPQWPELLDPALSLYRAEFHGAQSDLRIQG